VRARPAIPLVLCAVALAWSAGCAEGRYVYSPEENATARLSGQPAAFYQIPLQSPRGDVRVATLGIATLAPQGDEENRIRTMHVRMVVDNNDEVATWQVDTREQLGSLDRYGQSRPAFASSSAGRPPLVAIAPRASVTLDLYYPLPADMQKASEIPQFSLLWRVETPEGAVAERTSFERLRIEPPPPQGYYAWGLGLGWGWGPGWYDPLWPDYAFWGTPVLAMPYYARPVVRGPRPPPPRPAPARVR
jgi:hypothetical protein